MRNLRSGYQQPQSLVCDPVQRFRTDRAQMECHGGERPGSASLLWGSPRWGLYQPMVGFGVLATETGLHEVGTPQRSSSRAS